MDDFETDPDLLTGPMPTHPAGNGLGQLNGFGGHEAEEEDQVSMMSPGPGRRRGNRGGSKRLSLAFELASAMGEGGDEVGNKLLEEEFGIKEEDEQGEEVGSDEGGESLDGRSDGIEEGESLGQSWNEETVDGNEYREEEEEKSHGGLGLHTPIKASRSSLSPARVGTPTPRTPSRSHLTNGASTGRDTPDPDAQFLSASSALEDSLSTTQMFLTRLRTHSSVEVSGEGVVKGVSAETDMAFVDRQPLVEKLVYDVVRNLYDEAKERDGQIRELKEAEREIMRNEKAWMEVLGEMEELEPFKWEKEELLLPVEPLEGEDEDAEEDREREDNELDGQITPQRPKRSRSSSVSSYGEVIPPGSPLSLENAAPLPLAFAPPSATIPPIQSLRNITASLINQLTRINETGQVHQAQTGEAGRKLKHLRGVLGTWKEELKSVERSREAIEEWEREEVERKRDGWGSQAKAELESAREALERASKSDQYAALRRDKGGEAQS